MWKVRVFFKQNLFLAHRHAMADLARVCCIVEHNVLSLSPPSSYHQHPYFHGHRTRCARHGSIISNGAPLPSNSMYVSLRAISHASLLLVGNTTRRSCGILSKHTSYLPSPVASTRTPSVWRCSQILATLAFSVCNLTASAHIACRDPPAR